MRPGKLRRVFLRPVWAFWLCLAAAAPTAAHAKRAPMPAASAAAEPVFSQVEPYPYRIVPGDELKVDYGLVLEGKEVTATVLVRPDGVVTLPRIGEVRAAGRSTAELDSILAGLYEDVYVSPAITVAVTRLAGNLVHVLGEVRTPGSFPMQPNASALQAIAQAGGFQDDARRGQVLVLRRTGETQVAVKKVNTKDLLSGGKGSGDLLLRRNDIVYVNRSSIGNLKVFSEHVLSPLLTAGDVYIRGWTVVNIDRVFPTRERLDLQP